MRQCHSPQDYCLCHLWSYNLSLSLSLSLLQSKHPMHSNLHNPYTTKNYKHQIQPTLHTIPKWILVLGWGRFLQISVLKSLPKTSPPKKNLSRNTIFLSSSRWWANFFRSQCCNSLPKNKTNKKEKKKKKKPNQKILQKPIHQSGDIQSLNAHLDYTNLKKWSEDDDD